MVATLKCSKCGNVSSGTLTCPVDGTALSPETTAELSRPRPDMLAVSSFGKTLAAGLADTEAKSASPKFPNIDSQVTAPRRINARIDDGTHCGIEAAPIQVADEAANSLIGTVLDNQYQIIEKIGQGGMSVVYKARHLMLRKIVAIKTMLPHLVQHPMALQRFQQEAQAASNIVHTNIITIYNFGITPEGQPYLVMDYLEGQSLGDLIAQEGFLPVDRALNIFVQVSNALADAHKRGVIHRDLKPSNIILIEQGEKKDVVQIVDFGIAKMLRQDDEEATALTQTGEVFGSPLYMSPEQCKGEKLDLRADIYSMGCLMYETLTGKAPLIGSNTLEVLYKHINEIPAAMSTKQHPVSAKLESIVFKSLAKLPADRYQTMDDLERDLVSFQKYQQWSFFSFLRHRAELARLKQLPKSRREVIATRCIVAALVAFSCAALYPFFAFWNTANDPITRESLELDDDRPPEVEERHEYDKKSWEIARAQAQSYLNGASADVSPAVIYGALLKQGRYHSGNGSFELALQAFQLAYEFSVHVNGYNAYPSLHALLEKASIEYNLSSWDAAAKSYERFNELVRGLKREDERNAFYEARRGNCYWNLGQFDRAKQAFDGAIRLWSKPIRSPARGDAFADNEVTKDDIYLYALTKTRLAKILQNELKEANTDKHSEDYEIEIKRSAQLYFSALPLWRSITGNNEKNLGITELQLAELIQNRPQLQLMRRASFGDNSQLMKQDAEPESLFERGVKSIERSCGTNHEYYAIALLRRADYAWKQHHYWQALQERYSACEVLSRFQSAKMTK